MTEMYDNPQHVEDTFTESNLSEYLLQAQWAEFVELKKAIVEIYKKKKSSLKVLDIGIGDARILKHLVGIKEVWDAIEHYHGIDVAQNCINISNKIIKDLKIECLEKSHDAANPISFIVTSNNKKIGIIKTKPRQNKAQKIK